MSQESQYPRIARGKKNLPSVEIFIFPSKRKGEKGWRTGTQTETQLPKRKRQGRDREEGSSTFLILTLPQSPTFLNLPT